MTALWRTSLVVTSAVVTAAVLGGCQRSEAAPPPIHTSMHVVNHRPVIDAEVVNASGDAYRVKMLVDTAGEGVVFTAAAAERASLRLGDRQRLGGGVYATAPVKALRVGSTELAIAGIDPLVAVDANPEGLEGVDGMIGAQVLQRYERVTMNFPAEQIVLGEPPTAPTLGTAVPATFKDGLVTARVTLGRTDHRLLVDSSAVTTHIRADVPIRITGTRQGVWGRVVLTPFEVVSDPEELVEQSRGRLGGNLLERFTLRIDYERETLRISTT